MADIDTAHRLDNIRTDSRLDNIPIGTAIMHIGHSTLRVVSSNQEFAKFFRQSKKQLYGKNLLDFFPMTLRPILEDKLAQCDYSCLDFVKRVLYLIDACGHLREVVGSSRVIC